MPFNQFLFPDLQRRLSFLAVIFDLILRMSHDSLSLCAKKVINNLEEEQNQPLHLHQSHITHHTHSLVGSTICLYHILHQMFVYEWCLLHANK